MTSSKPLPMNEKEFPASIKLSASFTYNIDGSYTNAVILPDKICNILSNKEFSIGITNVLFKQDVDCVIPSYDLGKNTLTFLIDCIVHSDTSTITKIKLVS